MKKKDYIMILSMLIFVVALYFVSWLFSDDTEFRIVMGVVLLLIWFSFFVFVLLYRLLPKRNRETLEIKLSRQGFNTQKSFHYANDMGANVTLYVDFDSKQFASNVIYNNVIPFSRIANGRVEILPYGINSNKSNVHYVITIRRKGSDNAFDYIEMFNTFVNNADLTDKEEITEQMIAKYPSLKEIVELDAAIQQIAEINKSDGLDATEVDDEEWCKATESNDIDYDPNENATPNYTKPPFSDKRW
ncbi:MAG: hypothetical protein J1F66_03840 [Clostridiales bacterium]|nr:hypothetical protein [Clostridiales bacterium]